MIEGTRGTHYTKTVEFQILRCDEESETRESNGPTCKSREEIDEFIQDVEIEIWANN